MNEFVGIEENECVEIIEKKSKFIANLIYVENKLDAEEKIKEIKKKYFDSKHNCFAYRIIENESIVEKFSDDGEPQGTAGAPILNIIKNNNLCNILVIVTRYFGGILLGTGGLVRAYSNATIKVIEKAVKVNKCIGYECDVILEYSNLGSFKYYCKKNNIKIIKIDYLNVVICKIEVENIIKNILLEDIKIKKININNIEVLCKKYITKSVKK